MQESEISKLSTELVAVKGEYADVKKGLVSMQESLEI